MNTRILISIIVITLILIIISYFLYKKEGKDDVKENFKTDSQLNKYIKSNL